MVNAAGTYPLTLTATSPAGTTHQSYTLHVTAPELASGVSAQPGNKKATVKWKAPVLHGGLPVTGYVVTPYIGHVRAAVAHVPLDREAPGHRRLSNGRTYVFKVAVMNRLGTGPNSLSRSQINALGTGPTSTASPAIKIGAPTAPAVVKASASNDDRRRTDGAVLEAVRERLARHAATPRPASRTTVVRTRSAVTTDSGTCRSS